MRRSGPELEVMLAGLSVKAKRAAAGRSEA